MANPAEDRYMLARGFLESNRLNLQHCLFKEALGFDLHPSVDIARQAGLKVADVGTGTGVSQMLSEDAQLDGYDISGAQYPPPFSLPKNVSLTVLNAKQPVPDELREKYDVVHLRLFLAVVDDDDITPILQHCLAMLKPGGYLQWDEMDLAAQEYVGEPGAAHASLKRLCFRPSEIRPMQWVPRMPEDFKKAGLTDIETHRTREKVWQRQLMMENLFAMSEGVAQSSLKNGVPTPERWNMALALTAAAYQESRNGACFSQMFQVVVGRKAS